jgi:3-methyl-2-oxobutanoate hydroxymethyltransferase
MTSFGIALGSNLGDREANFQRGVQELLERIPGAHLTAAASLYETEPVDCAPGTAAFLNTVIEIEAALSPSELHHHLQAIEQAMGRISEREKNAPRTLDLDLLYAGDYISANPDLTVPHPRLHLRRFVLQPLAEIRPNQTLPGMKRSVAVMLADLGDDPASVTCLGPWITAPPPMLNSLSDLPSRKLAGTRLAVLTAYDYPTARLLDEAGVDLLLVGDSLGMVVLGMPDTTGVTMDMIVHHTVAVRRGTTRAPIIADLPFQSYRTPEEALANSRRLIAAGADAVKLEGGTAFVPQVRAIVEAGIPFVGHLGMLPQSVKEEGGYKKKGKTEADAQRLIAEAIALDEAGACAIVLESIVADVATEITRRIKASTIGIGSGTHTDGQVLVTPDLLGSFPWFRPPFAKPRADVAAETLRAVREYIAEVQA